MCKNILLSVCVRVDLLKEQLRDKFVKSLIATLGASPVIAFADGDIADMGIKAAAGGTSLTKSALTLAQFGGVLFVIGGVIAAKQKKDNPQIKTSHILSAIVFGAILIVIPEFIKRAQTQVGLTPVSVG